MANAIKMHDSPQASDYTRGLPKAKALNACNKKSAEFTSILASELHKAGYEPITDEWINNQSNYLIFNRGHDGRSNFYVFVRPKKNFFIFKSSKVEVTFTDPRTDEKALELNKNQIIVKLTFSNGAGQAEAADCVNKIVEVSKGKKENEYYFHTHGHMGKIFNPTNNVWENIWDDGVSKDIECLTQAMLWNYDFFSLTSHNWCHNRLRLGWLSRIFSKAGMTFVPGCEITMPSKLKDENGKIIGINLWLGPHILVHFANNATALEIQDNLLAEKLDQKTGPVTPILGGPPIDIEKQLEHLKKYHDKGELDLGVAHPFSRLLNGKIALLGRKSVAEKGYQKMLEIESSDPIDAVEIINCGESLSPTLTFDAEEDQDQRKKLQDANYPVYLSSPNLNKNNGEICKAKGRKNYAGHDDHKLPPLEWMCSYGQAITKITMPETVQKMLVEQGRKARSDELVYSMAKGVFPGTNDKVLCEAIMFIKQTKEGPDFVDARKQTAVEKIICRIGEEVPYTANLAVAELRYWGAAIFGNKFMGEEYLKEVEKAKARDLERSKLTGLKSLTEKINVKDGLKSLSSRIKTFRLKP